VKTWSFVITLGVLLLAIGALGLFTWLLTAPDKPGPAIILPTASAS
jgi:hypothetical protein